MDCFTLSDQSIDGASAIARQIDERYASRGIRILPVPMRVDEGEKEKADAGRALARARFEGFPDGLTGEELTSYWGSVEIPYRPYYAYEEILAAFGDQPGVASSLLGAFERLTTVITDGRITRLPPLDEDRRLRVLDAFTRRRPAPRSDVRLLCAPQDRMWAEWAEALLSRAGFLVRRYDGTAPEAEPDPLAADRGVQTVVILSEAYVRSISGRATREGSLSAELGGGRRNLVLRVGEVRLPGFPIPYALDIARLDEHTAGAALLRALDRGHRTGTEVTAGLRFPGAVPRMWNAPPRNAGFTGRDRLMDWLRDRLGFGGRITLTGLGGVGKTQIALEYVHRFMSDYDLVWWIEAEQPEQVVTGLADLAVRLGLPVTADLNEAARSALDALGRGEPSPRWLLVFDNADDPALLRGLSLSGGHVLVTARDRTWADYGDTLEADVFLREESVEHLLRRAPGLEPADAQRVANAVGDLPLAVEQAAAWLAETATPVHLYLEQLTEEAARPLALNQPPDYPAPVAATWNVSIVRLRERSPAAVRLLQLCAFLGPEPIATSLLYSEGMTAALLPYDPALSERLVLGRIVRDLGRFALAKLDQHSSAFQVHRLVQSVVRSQLDPEEQRETRHTVHGVLAAARPPGDEPVDDPDTWPWFAVLWPHLEPSEAADCADPATRALLVDRVRYLWRRGDPGSALALARELGDRWLTRFGAHDPPSLRLRHTVAAVLRAQGDHHGALRADEETLALRRAAPGPGDPDAPLTLGALAEDLVLLGRYGRALDRSAEAYRTLLEAHGADHPRTLTAAEGHARTLRCAGRYREALELDRATHDTRARSLGPDHPLTLASASAEARGLRETDRAPESVTRLTGLHEAHVQRLGEDHPVTLAVASSLAVSLRRAGRAQESLRIALRTHEHHRAEVAPGAAPAPSGGPPPTGGTADALAAALHLAVARTGTDPVSGLALAVGTHEEYRALLGAEHPVSLTALCAVVWARYAAGVPGATPLASTAHRGLLDALGEEHPHVWLSAGLYGAVLARDGSLPEAERYERRAVTGLTRVLGPDHSLTLAHRLNLSVTLEAKGWTTAAAALRAVAEAGLTARLGAGHPVTERAARGERVNSYLEPPPW